MRREQRGGAVRPDWRSKLVEGLLRGYCVWCVLSDAFLRPEGWLNWGREMGAA